MRFKTSEIGSISEIQKNNIFQAFKLLTKAGRESLK